MKKSDMMIGIYILAAIVFLIIPIPTQLLDVLMAQAKCVGFVITTSASGIFCIIRRMEVSLILDLILPLT